MRRRAQGLGRATMAAVRACGGLRVRGEIMGFIVTRTD
jgi:hypothetical protein